MSERLVLEVAGSGRPAAELPAAGVLVVGSDGARAGLTVDAAGVDGVHCAIGRTKGGGWAVKDLGSLAGTLLNGQRVEAARIGDGDELRLGEARLRVVDPAAAAAPRAARTPRPDETQTLDAADLAQDLQGTAAPARPAAAAAKTKPAALPAIAGMRIEKRIGRGGMGDVYLAVQESLQRQVAVKVLATRFADDAAFVRRFQAEARAAAALNHPNVVTVYDVGEDRGTHYLSMEYMDRGTLEDRVQAGGRLAVDEVLSILRDAAAGLVYAEARGIVHRDLKPANLMQNHLGQTKIADLGLATHVESEEMQTADRKVFGTPHFMSPEQARGERLDHRSDLYSLGATAYRLLTGHTPFEGQDAREIVRALLRDEPRAMREFVPDLPPGVVALVERLMRKDAAQRFGTAQEALREIESLRARGGAGAAPAGTRRSPALSVFAVLIVVGGAAWWWFAGRGAPDAGPPGGRGPQTGPTAPGSGAALAGDPDAPVAPAQPPAVEAAPARPATPKEKDDQELRLFEANARVALLELLQREMPATERRDELRLLAQRFQGTTAATEALAKAESISTALDANAQADQQRQREIAETVAKLRSVARLDADPPEPGKSFLAMRTLPVPAGLVDDADYAKARKEVENQVIGIAVHYAREAMGEANRALGRGDFESAKATLGALLPVFDLPEFALGQAPSGVDELFEVGRQARERFHNLEQLKTVFERQRSRADGQAFATAFGGPGGLERELLALDFPAARARLERLAGELAGPEEQARARALAADCAAAQTVIDALSADFGAWRRKSFNDPRERRNIARNAMGVDAQGILFESEPGKLERVGWSAFGGNVKEIGRLLVERLSRDWTPDEQAGIAVLMRLTAVVEAAQIAGKMFDPAKRSNFTEGNARDLLDVFQQAHTWTERVGGEARARLAREADAAAVLAAALRAATEGRWAAAAAGIERLITEFGDTLLVLLYSDGRPIAELSGG